MKDLDELVALLAPAAKTILEIAEKGPIGERIAQAEEVLADLEQRVKNTGVALAAGKAELERVRSECISRTAAADEMVKTASKQASDLVNNARAVAEGEAKKVMTHWEEAIEKIKEQYENASIELETLENQVSARQADHSAVLASIASLKSRLGAA